MLYIDVSLCLTTYNEQSSIGKLLSSISNQTVQPREVIICDGGSSDETVPIINEFKENSNININLIQSNSRVNISKGRNIAISYANYKIIAVTDAGCILDNLWLLNITRHLIDNENISIVGGYYQPLIENDFHRKLAYVLFVKSSFYNSTNFIPSSRSLSFRKSVWEEVGGYPEYLKLAAEDTLFIVNCKKVGYSIYFEPQAYVFWNMRDNLTSARKVHFIYGYGEGEADLFTVKYLFYFVCLFFPFLLIVKRNKYKFIVLQYILVFEMFRGWLKAKQDRFLSYLS